jgi:hypothetical protein
VRALRLTPRFQRELADLAPRGSLAWRAVRRALNDLAREPHLPRTDDSIVELPYAIPSRAVPEAGLTIGYVAAPDELNAVTLQRR